MENVSSGPQDETSRMQLVVEEDRRAPQEKLCVPLETSTMPGVGRTATRPEAPCNPEGLRMGEGGTKFGFYPKPPSKLQPVPTQLEGLYSWPTSNPANIGLLVCRAASNPGK